MGADGFHRFGELHADWPVVRLRAVARHRSEWVAVADDREYLRVTARSRNQGIELRDRVLGDKIRTKRQQLVRAGDLLVAEIDAKVGGFGIVPQDLDGAIVSSHYFLFEIDNRKLTESWLDQFVKAGKMQRQVDAVGSTNYASIRPQDVLTFQIPLPDVAEQRHAAKVLDAVDESIARTHRLISALVATKHAVMRELLTKGHSKHKTKLVPLPESWPIGRIASTIDKMPSHWKLVTLTKIAKLESGHTPSRKHPEYWNGDIPWLSLGDTSELKKLQVEKTSECVTQAGIDNSSARLLPADTVVLSRTAVRGLCSRLAKPMATSQDFVAFVCGPKVLPAYLMQLFRHMQREWRRLEQGSSPTNKTLYFSVFNGLKILLPPPDEQAAIAEVGEAFDVRIATEARYLEQLRHTKRGLAQALLSGRVRVGAGKTNGARAANGAARRR
jgi:type I restriction enzyme S subunit